MTFSTRLGAAQDAARAGADGAITALAEIAHKLDMDKTRAQLENIGELLRSDRFTVTVVGNFDAGKSTLLNALLGDTTHPVDLEGAPGPLPASLLPCSAVLTQVVYSEMPYVRVWGFDGTVQTWSLARYLREAPLDTSAGEKEDQKRFAHIARFELGYPARLLQHVELYDSPGLNDTDTRNTITKEACAASDAVIAVFSSHQLMGTQELRDTQAAMEGKFKEFTVVNLFAPAAADRKMRGHVWNKYVRPRFADPDAHPWADQDLESTHRIHFVDAWRSLAARAAGDEVAVKTHGLTAFEEQLGDFLVDERATAHIHHHATDAEALGRDIAGWVRSRIAAYTASTEKFDAWRRQMTLALHETEQRATAIHDVVTRHQREAGARLDDSFHASELAIRADLEQFLAVDADIPVLNGVLAGLQPAKVQTAIQDATKDFVASRRDSWMTGEGRTRLEDALARLTADLTRELGRAAQPLQDAQLAMTGGENFDSDFRVIGRAQQIAAAAVAVVTGNAAVALGASGGFRSVAGGIGGLLTAGLLIAVVGVTGPIIIPIALVMAALGSMFGAKVGLRKTFVRKLLPEIRRVLTEAEPARRAELKAHVESVVARIGAEVEREFQDLIDKERAELEEKIRQRSHEDAERRERLSVLEWAGREIDGHIATLRDAIAAAPQQLTLRANP